MPLDGHSYLRNQGWSGNGTGLRLGSISRPLTIPQKRTLAGVGKDRDDAFPFWDHLFTAAATAIQVKLADDDHSSAESTPAPQFKRTSTGILSNRRPIEGTPATSGTSTPALDSSSSDTPRISLIATAKKEAAKRGLYSRFFRGPIVGPNEVEVEMIQTETRTLPAKLAEEPQEVVDAISKGMSRAVGGDETKKADKEKRKRQAADTDSSTEDIDKREKKRRKKEQREANKASKKQRQEEDSLGASNPDPKSSAPAEAVGDDLSPPVSDSRDEQKKRKQKKDKRRDRDRKTTDGSSKKSKPTSHDFAATSSMEDNSIPSPGGTSTQGSKKPKRRAKDDDSQDPVANRDSETQHRQKKKRKNRDTD